MKRDMARVTSKSMPIDRVANSGYLRCKREGVARLASKPGNITPAGLPFWQLPGTCSFGYEHCAQGVGIGHALLVEPREGAIAVGCAFIATDQVGPVQPGGMAKEGLAALVKCTDGAIETAQSVVVVAVGTGDSGQ